jgi:hypothetical protein
MKNGKYETALTDYIPANVKEWQPIHVELLTAAGTIDRLTADIIRDCETMSTRFEAYAIDLKLRGEGWSPMGYSSLRDIDLNIAQLAVHKEYFHNLLRSINPELPKTFLKLLAA